MVLDDDFFVLRDDQVDVIVGAAAVLDLGLLFIA